MSSRKNDSPIKEVPCESYKFSYNEFDNVDHRLKLYLYSKIFEDVSEHLKWIVKGRMCLDTAVTSQTNNEKNTLNGIFVMSTIKFYVLQMVGKEK